MRIITCLFLILVLILPFGIGKISLDTRLAKSCIQTAEKEVLMLFQETRALDKYKDERVVPLEKFYPEVYSDIKEICAYYRAPSEIKIIGAKDLVNTEEFFKESQYKGVRYVDVTVQIELKDHSDMYLVSVLSKFTKTRPIEILGLALEKDSLNLTLRLYGA